MAVEGSGRPAARLPRAASVSAVISLTASGIVLLAGVFGAPGSLAAAGGASASSSMPTAAAKPAAKAPIVNSSWKELPTAQQQALSPLATEWDKLDSAHKSKWLVIARKFETMKPDEQNRIQERMRAWVALTPDQRRVARESYARTKKLNTVQKSAQWQQYQQLPEEQKKILAAEAAKNKVATLPPAHSKPKSVPTIKSIQKPVLQQSIMPKPAVGPVTPTSPAAQPPASTVAPAPAASVLPGTAAPATGHPAATTTDIR
jgi:hypothetical protein